MPQRHGQKGKRQSLSTSRMLKVLILSFCITHSPFALTSVWSTSLRLSSRISIRTRICTTIISNYRSRDHSSSQLALSLCELTHVATSHQSGHQSRSRRLFRPNGCRQIRLHHTGRVDRFLRQFHGLAHYFFKIYFVMSGLKVFTPILWYGSWFFNLFCNVWIEIFLSEILVILRSLLSLCSLISCNTYLQ